MLLVHTEDPIRCGSRPCFLHPKQTKSVAGANTMAKLAQKELGLRIVNVEHETRAEPTRTGSGPDQEIRNVVDLDDANATVLSQTSEEFANPEEERGVRPEVLQQSLPTVSRP